MSNQEMPDFFEDNFNDLDEKMLKTCEQLFETELTSRGLNWQRFENNQKTGKYSIIFGTKEGLYITVTGDNIKECFEKAIAQYDQDMAGKEVPLDPITKQSDKLTVFKNEPQIDEKDSPSMIYQKIRNKLSQNVKNVSPEEARFFLEYFKDHIHEEDFELAADAQNIIGK